MNLESLKFFLRTAELGSVTKAALAMGTVQPIVSRAIAQLERDIGSRLFQRTGHGVQLTALGESLLPRARSIVHEMECFIVEGQAFINTPAGDVRIGVLTSFATNLVPLLLRQSAAVFPDVKLKIMVGTVTQIREWLEEGKIDISFNFGDGDRLGDAHLLGSLDVYLIGRKAAGLDLLKTIDLNRIIEFPLIVPPPRSYVRKKLDALADEYDLALNIFMEVDTSRLQLKLVEEGYGYAVMSLLTLSQQGLDTNFSAARIVNPGVMLRVMVGTSTRNVPTLAVREIAKLAGQIGEQMIAQIKR